ncbi:MAG: ATP-binding protein [Cyanobacteria bacterium J06554_6]
MVTATAADAGPVDKAFAERLLGYWQAESIILGAAIYEADNYLMGQGNYPQVDAAQMVALLDRPQLNRDSQTFDTALQLNLSEPPLYLVVRHDAQPIRQALRAYTARMIAAVIIIAVVVTASTMTVVDRLIIRPVLLLHGDLRRASAHISSGIQTQQFEATGLRQQNELGEVIDAFQDMHDRIWQAISDRETARQQAQKKAEQLQETVTQLHQTQSELVQAEKLAGLGKLAAGMAHEINNPVTFIHSNIPPVETYLDELVTLVRAYQAELAAPSPELKTLLEEIDFDFLQADYPKITGSLLTGTERIKTIIDALKNFSRLDEAGIKSADLRDCVASTVMMLRTALSATSARPEITVVQSHVSSPVVMCNPALINQVFLDILTNAIEAIDRQTPPLQNPTIWIETRRPSNGWIEVMIKNNGVPLTAQEQQRLFDPFYTTKAVGDGTGISLFNCYQIIHHQHQGELACVSQLGELVTFMIRLPSGSASKTCTRTTPSPTTGVSC